MGEASTLSGYEQANPQGQVADETGRHPLQLREKARFSGNEHQRFLATGNGGNSGFALKEDR